MGLPAVESVMRARAAQGGRAAAGGPQVDLMIMPPGEAGTYLIHFTGSKEHNVRLRGMARDRGWSLSEKGFLRLGETASRWPATQRSCGPSPRRRRRTRSWACRSSNPSCARIAARSRPPWRGAADAGRAGRSARRLPHPLRLVGRGAHDRADGARRRAGAATAYLVLTDHTAEPGDRPRPGTERVEPSGRRGRLNERFAREEAAGRRRPRRRRRASGCCTAASWRSGRTATLDYADELLARYDVVVASLHVARRQPREQLTARTLAAHPQPARGRHRPPAGRYIGTRDDLDLDWDAVYRRGGPRPAPPSS